MTETIVVAVIGGSALVLATGMTAMVSIITQGMVKKQQMHLMEMAQTILLLERNTNSIKDALVRVTAEAEFAKGFLLGQKTKE